jgi:hypothetical protein
MFIALRRFTLVATLVLERTMDKKRHDRMTYLTISVMLSGQSDCLSVRLSMYLIPTYLFVCLSACLSDCLQVHQVCCIVY